MADAVSSSVGVVAYLALFGAVGIAFVFVNLLIGRFLRPSNPEPEKLEIYECGEPAIGTSFVQFDLRFYVVALVFIIFDVEVAFLFPWATVFGKATALMDRQVPVVATASPPGTVDVAAAESATLSDTASGLFEELGVRNPQPAAGMSASALDAEIRQASGNLLWISVWAVAVFFAVLLIGLAYEWRSGALDWVRAVTHAPVSAVERAGPEQRPAQESVLSA